MFCYCRPVSYTHLLTLYNFDNRVIDVTHALDSTFKNSYQINVGLQSLGLRPRGHSDMTKSFNQFLKESELNKHTYRL